MAGCYQTLATVTCFNFVGNLGHIVFSLIKQNENCICFGVFLKCIVLQKQTDYTARPYISALVLKNSKLFIPLDNGSTILWGKIKETVGIWNAAAETVIRLIGSHSCDFLWQPCPSFRNLLLISVWEYSTPLMTPSDCGNLRADITVWGTWDSYGR